MTPSPSADTQRKHSHLVPWKPGQSGNPKGRTKGARTKLAESFIADVFALWEEHGPAILMKAAADDPPAFVRMVASLVPRNVKVELGASDAFVQLLRDAQAKRVGA